MSSLLRYGTSLLMASQLFVASSVGAEVPAPLAIGASFPDFKLPDTTGREHRLSDYENKIVVFVFGTPECPCSRSVDGALRELSVAYADKGVVFLGVNANFFIDAETLRDYAAQANIPYRILKDDDEVLADALGARVTPEVFVKDGKGKLAYHGPPDNRPSPTGAPTEHFLQDALAALTSGKPVARNSVTPWGCSIRSDKTSASDTDHAGTKGDSREQD